MKRLFGNTGGLKASQIRRLENLYRRRIPTEFVVTFEIAREISKLSHEIRRQIGLLVNRPGKIAYVIAGNYQGIVIPDISEYRAAPGRLKGLRCIHTHLKNEPLTKDDFTDLVLLRLDMIAAITITTDGRPNQVHVGHILPASQKGEQYRILAPLNPGQLDIGCLELIKAVETELAHARHLYKAGSGKERAILISVTTAPRRIAMDSLAELNELALSSGIDVAATVLQQRRRVDSRFLIGPGKLQDITILILKNGATLIIFDQELNPSQMRSISDKIDIKIIDRTQLILDIFAQRAQTREGKLQVELAQLKYLLPRLIAKNTAMSRLTGGIGGRGPGETKLEIHRRRVRDRITRLEKDLLLVKKQRKQQKARRQKKDLPVISIIGYTNAGKSTLLNTLTKSRVRVEDRLFATLDPSSRRLKFPKDVEVIITDTVGFIKNLPKELMVAFRATFEELESADILLHIIDIGNARFKDHIESVEKILGDLNLNNIPLIRVLNKQDLVDKDIINRQIRQLDGIAVSANNESTLTPLLEKMHALVGG
ncbi:MAG: GTPase HflX [Thermodesulfobacteriota bacterium]|nr:GTPase HflX [Thermodesulfobacteriota bacterium]